MASDAYCPTCGGPLACDAVDIGVGVMQGPLYCTECGWNENSGPEENFLDCPEDFLDPDESDKGSRRGGRRRSKESG